MSQIILNNINKFYGKNHVLKNLNLTVKDGEFLTLLGPSGCGKTTSLRIIAGLEKPQTGTIIMDEKLVVDAEKLYFEPASKRGLNLVFQSYALWPHMTVFDNVAFGLQVKKKTKHEINTMVETALKKMRIEEFSKRYPSELSGGQQQRVAIARAIVTNPSVLLLDEPLSNLDAKLRLEMRAELKKLHRELGTTIIYVTHDQSEALTMSTRIALFFEGVLEQLAVPIEIYKNPASLKVANFIGSPAINIIAAKAVLQDELNVESPLGNFKFSDKRAIEENIHKSEFSCLLGIRPEKLKIYKTEKQNTIKATVNLTQVNGSETTVFANVNGEEIVITELGINEYDYDEIIYVEIDVDNINVFDKESQKLIVRILNCNNCN